MCASDRTLYGSDCSLMETACRRQTNITVKPFDYCQGLLRYQPYLRNICLPVVHGFEFYIVVVR